MMGSRRRAGNRLKEMARQGNMSIKPDPRHVEQTACLAEDEFQAASLREKPMRFPAFVLRQIRYAGRYVFGLQAVLLLLILTVFYYVSIRWDLREPGIFWYLYRRIPLLLCGAGVMAAWSCVPVLSRSYRWKMAEVEAAACSQIRLRMAWLCIGGGSAIFTGGGSCRRLEAVDGEPRSPGGLSDPAVFAGREWDLVSGSQVQRPAVLYRRYCGTDRRIPCVCPGVE